MMALKAFAVYIQQDYEIAVYGVSAETKEQAIEKAWGDYNQHHSYQSMQDVDAVEIDTSQPFIAHMITWN